MPRDLQEKGEKVGAIVLAAGRSERMGGEDKLFVPLAGKPLLAWAVEAFENCPLVGKIVVVLNNDNLGQGKALAQKLGWKKVKGFCLGGARRQDSVRAGLERLGTCAWVIIHDGARPCIDQNLIAQGLALAQKEGAAVAAFPLHDTIKEVGQLGEILGTIPRERLWAAQTPQVFRYDIIWEAHQRVRETATDDAALVETLGYPVKVYEGSRYNIKVTTPEDLILAELVLSAKTA